MFPAIYHRADDSREVHLASSVDGVNWHWVPGGPVIRHGALGEWNGSDVAASRFSPARWQSDCRADQRYQHPHKYPRGSEPFGAPGWAVCSKGRLCALEAEDVGEFATPDLILTGNELSLNVRTREAGVVRVELRDESGHPLPGHCFADADPLVADGDDVRVSWHGRTNLAEWRGKPVSMAFQLRKAQLFGFESSG